MRKKYAKYDDKELLQLMRSGKEEAEAAFTEIYDRYALRVNAYCKTVLNSTEQAEDIFQETFLKFFQYASSEKSSDSVIGFLIKIARNLCLNVKRDAKQTVNFDNLDLPFLGDQSYEDKETGELIMLALDLIDAELKEVIIMRYFNDLSYKEIGKILEINEARARYLAFTGKQKLKQVLKPYFRDNIENRIKK